MRRRLTVRGLWINCRYRGVYGGTGAKKGLRNRAPILFAEARHSMDLRGDFPPAIYPIGEVAGMSMKLCIDLKNIINQIII